MATLADELLLEVLKACAAGPLYPVEFASYSGLDRATLDEALDHLRLRGLVRFTDWQRDKGQGYTITSQGTLVLQNPRLLRRAPAAPAEPAPARQLERGDRPWARGEAVRETLLNPIRPVACMTLLGLNILVFAIGWFMAVRQGASAEEYLFKPGNMQVELTQEKLGSLNQRDVLVGNQWWRLLSYAFVHAGILHIGMNMYFLFSLGPLLETLWGSARFLWLYLVAALWGGCAVMLTQRAAVGASGALCGLLTSLGVWVYLNRRHLPGNLVSNWMRVVFINCILIAVISSLPAVSWEGHLGGAIGGALVSLPLNFQRFDRGLRKFLGLAGALAVPVIGVAVVGLYLRHDLSFQFHAAEERAVTAFYSNATSLLQSWDKGHDTADVEAAKAAFASAQRQLEQTLRAFDEAAPIQDQGIADSVARARSYLAEWAKFFTAFEKVLGQPQPWPADDQQTLLEQMVAVSRAQHALINPLSSVYKRFAGGN